ncbi:MAG TPA: amidohydrolase family protein [Gaiellaceae bacterium]|nr:amidohydrolase family protein [Gaiellaceae bacterium]
MAAYTLPGFVSAHSHGFQRSLRGRGAGGDFWVWRDAMLAEAARQTVASVRSGYEDVYRELRESGFTAVGEFHYLGLAEAFAALEAADAAGVTVVLLLAAYERGGIDRFRQGSIGEYLEQLEALRAAGARVGVAPHSVRACSAAWLTEIGRYAAREGLVLHVHADEQPREIEECLAEHGVRPIELLARCGCLNPSTTVVHATHADAAELDLLADAGACVCLCPTTEANLGDGFPPLEGLLERGIPLAIGSDSNVRIDPLEELRELEGTARRQTGRREIISVDELLAIGSANGAHSLGLEAWPNVQIDLAHPTVRGVARADARAALLFSCAADVVMSAD